MRLYHGWAPKFALRQSHSEIVTSTSTFALRLRASCCALRTFLIRQAGHIRLGNGPREGSSFQTIVSFFILSFPYCSLVYKSPVNSVTKIIRSFPPLSSLTVQFAFFAFFAFSHFLFDFTAFRLRLRGYLSLPYCDLRSLRFYGDLLRIFTKYDFGTSRLSEIPTSHPFYPSIRFVGLTSAIVVASASIRIVGASAYRRTNSLFSKGIQQKGRSAWKLRLHAREYNLGIPMDIGYIQNRAPGPRKGPRLTQAEENR